MKIVAFDLATTTGIAIGDTTGKPVGQTEQLGDVGGLHGRRFAYAMRLTSDLIRDHRPDLVVIEEPIANGPVGDRNRLMMAMGLRGVVFSVCSVRKVRVAEYSVNTIRKHFIGNGFIKSAAAKKATFERCVRLGWHPANFDEADAMAVWDLARAHHAKLTTPTPNGLFDFDS